MKRLFYKPLWAGVFALCLISPVFPQQSNGKVILLDEAVEIALKNNVTLKAAQANLKAAGYRVKKSRLDLLPKADLQLGYARLDAATVRRGNVFVGVGRSLVEQFSDGDPNDIRPGAYSNNFSTVLQVVQPIYNGGARWAAIGAARAREDGSKQGVEDTRQQVILDVKTRYLNVLQANELVVLAKKSLEAAEEHLQSSKNMLEVGLRSRTDVLRWEVQKATSEGQLVEAENNLKFAEVALKQVMGLPYTEEFALQPVAFEPVAVTEDLQQQIEKSKNRNPGLKAVSAAVDAQRAGVRLAWSAFQPKVNFVYQFGWEKNNTLAPDSFSYWNAGVSVALPLFHSFSNVAQLQESKARLNHMVEKEEEARQLLTLEVIRAGLNVETALKKYHIAQKAVEQAAENLRVLNNTYQVGLAANIDVLDGQVAHTKTATDLIGAKYDYLIAKTQLERAVGTLSE